MIVIMQQGASDAQIDHVIERIEQLGLTPHVSRGQFRTVSFAGGGIELIYSSGPPDSSHVAAERLARRTGLPWIADCRDPWFNLHLKKPPSALHGAMHRRQIS